MALSNLERRNPVVNWSQIPPQPTPKWYESSKICKTAAKIFFTLSAVFAGAAILTVVTFSAVPIALGLGGAAVALVIAGLVLWNKTPSENDPDYCRQLRQEAGRNIEENGLSYPQIRLWHPQLIDRGLITNQELNELVKEDLNNLSYSQFMQKHSPQIIAVLRNHPQNFQTIQNKYLDHLAGREDFPGIRTLPLELETSALGIGYQELAARFANAEALRNNLTYEEFIRRNGPEILPYVTDEAALKHIENLFLAQAACLNEGVIATLQRYSPSLERFSEDLRERMIKMVVEQEVLQFLEGKLSYPQLRQRNGLAHIQAALLEDSIKNKARDVILALPYGDKNWFDYAEERALLGITNEDMLRAAYKQAEGLPYFGKNGFKETYGINMLRPEMMSKSHVQQILNELTNKILDCSFSKINSYLPDFARFNLQQKDVLALRWERKPLRDLLAEEEMQFFEVLPGGPRAWTGKVLGEAKAMNAWELLALSPKLFTSGILRANDMLTGISIQSMFEKEIITVATFEELLEQYGEIIFQQNLISKENDALEKLIKGFLERNSLTLILELEIKEKSDCLRVITEHKLLKKSFEDYLEEARSAVRMENQRLRNAIDSINNTFRKSDKKNKDECENQISLNTRFIRDELNAAEITFRASSKEKRGTDTSVADLESKLCGMQRTLKTLKEKFDLQTAERSNLQHELNCFPCNGDLRFLTNQLENLKNDTAEKEISLKTLEHQIKQSLRTDRFVVTTRNEIQALNMKFANLERENEAYRREIDDLEKKYSRRKKELASLEQEAINRRRESELTVRETIHGRRELGMHEREPLNRMREREPINHMREREPLHRDSERRESLDARLSSLRRDGNEVESKLRETKAKQTEALCSQTNTKNEIQHLVRQLEERLRTLENDPRPDQLKKQIKHLKAEQEDKEKQLGRVKETIRKISSADASIQQMEKEEESLESQIKSSQSNLDEHKKYQISVQADYQKAKAAVESKTQELKRIAEPFEKNYQQLNEAGETQRNNLLREERAIYEARLAAIDANFKSKLAQAEHTPM